MSLVTPPPAGTVALTAFRELPDGSGRQYTATTFPANPWQGCERFVRMCAFVGFVKDSKTADHTYAVMDAINEDGDILMTWDVTSAKAFRFIYRKLHLRVEDEDGR
jgi:hypothetical protein